MHCSEAENLSRVLAIGPIVGQSASDGGQGRYEPTHPPPLSRTHIRHHNLLTVCREFRAHKFKSFLFNLNPLHQITTQAELTNGVRHADPPDPMDDVLEVLMKNGGECLLKF